MNHSLRNFRSLLLTLEFAPVKGGIANYLFGLCKYVLSRGEKLLVITNRVEGYSNFDNALDFPVEIKRIALPERRPRLGRRFKGILWILWFSFATFYTVIKERITIVFCNQILPLAILAYLVKKIFGIPYLLILHGGEIVNPPKQRLRRWLRIKLINDARKVIVNSNYTKKLLKDLGLAEDKIFVLYPAIETSKFTRETSLNGNRVPLLNGKKILLTVSRLVPRKGIDMTLEALRFVLKEIPDLIYVVIGDGNDKENLKSKVMEYGISDHVIFLGSASEEEVISYYNLCDAFILPCRVIREKHEVEGFGIVFLEANACGKPVIGGDSGGASEAVIDGFTGLLVDPNDTAMISRCVIRLLSNKDLSEELGAQGKKRVQESFSWETRTEEISKAIEFGNL